jgi:hypothetical protein
MGYVFRNLDVKDEFSRGVAFIVVRGPQRDMLQCVSRCVRCFRFDMSLLLVFDERRASCNLGGAPARGAVSQLAVSHALRRVRQSGADALYPRTARDTESIDHGRRIADEVGQKPPRNQPLNGATSRYCFPIFALEIGEISFPPAVIAYWAKLPSSDGACSAVEVIKAESERRAWCSVAVRRNACVRRSRASIDISRCSLRTALHSDDRVLSPYRRKLREPACNCF